MSVMVRQPAVAGQFYEGSAEGLRVEIEQAYLDQRGPGKLPEVVEKGPRQLLGLVSPHAGYLYSGPIAAYGFAELARDGKPDCFVIIGPNHGRGSWTGAVQTAGAWATPLGQARVDEELGEALAEALPGLARDPAAFRSEHSLEVQLPFLQQLYGEDFRFVPLMMLEQEAAAAREVGEALGRVLAGREVVMIASTDMTHQEPRRVASAQDDILAQRIAALDPEGLLEARAAGDITMCGYGPTAAMLIAAKALGARSAQILRYGDSGEAHPMGTVVGYLSAAVYR